MHFQNGKRRGRHVLYLSFVVISIFRMYLTYIRRCSCPFTIATFATDRYTSHVNELRKSVLSITKRQCSLEVIHAGNELDLSRNNLTRSKVRRIPYRNPFAGVDAKVKAILGVLQGIPNESLLLWTDASVLLLNSLDFNIVLALKQFDILFIRERRGIDRLNLGVILMKNNHSIRKLFNETLLFTQKGYWDQGIVSCALGSKLGPKALEKNCTKVGIRRHHEILWSFLPDSFAQTTKVLVGAACIKDFSEPSPTFLKFTGDKARRFQCFKDFKKCLKVRYGFKYIRPSQRMRRLYATAHAVCLKRA